MSERSEFFLLPMCVSGGGGGGGVRFSTSPSVKKITDSLLLIKNWSLQQKVLRVTTSLIFFKILLVTYFAHILLFGILSCSDLFVRSVPPYVLL